jgi:hypothetical protein
MLECHMAHRISRCFVGLIRFVSNGPITFGELRRALPINLLINICGATRIVRGSLREDIYCNEWEPRSTAGTRFACGPT